MKKILVVLILCMVSIIGFGQKWDAIKYDIENCETVNFDSEPFQIKNIPNHNEKLLPSVVYDRYIFGEKLMTGGWITFGFGGVLTIIGGVLTGTCKEPTGIKMGYGMLSAGGAAISVSIPLLCFGDNAKRESNVVYDVFNLRLSKYGE